jgi:hypothetical protein
MSAARALRWSRMRSLRATKCSDVCLYKDLGEGGLGGASTGVGAGAGTGVGAAFGFAAGCGGGVGGSSSAGVMMGSTLTFRRGARSLLPAGRPLFGVGASVGGGVVFSPEFFGIVSEFSAFVGVFSGIFVAFSGIVASASAIFEIYGEKSVNRQGEADVGVGV